MTQATISYRKLGSADSAQYREIRLESLKLHPESYGSTYEEQSKLPKLMFERALEKGADDRLLFGAFDGEMLIGICGFVQRNWFGLSDAGTIVQPYVKSAYRGRRIGLSLVQAVIDEAFQDPDVRQIVLGVNPDNTSAIRVYEQAGFVKLDVKQDDAAVGDNGDWVNPLFVVYGLRPIASRGPGGDGPRPEQPG